MQFFGTLRTALFGATTIEIGVRRAIGFGYGPSERRALLIVMDGLLIVLALWGTLTLLPSVGSEHSRSAAVSANWYWFPIIIAGWSLSARLHDLYDVSSLHSRTLSMVRVISTSLTGAVVGLVVYLLLPVNTTIVHLLYAVGIAAPGLIGLRWIYSSVSTPAAFRYKTLIVGRGKRAQRAGELIKQHSYLNCQVLGYINDALDVLEQASDGLPVWNPSTELPRLVRQLQVDEIVIASESALDSQLSLALTECQANGTRVLWLPELYVLTQRNIPLEDIDSQWVLYAVQSRPDLMQRAAKRLLDLAIVLFALPVLLLLLPLIALAIHFDSPGPVFYRQVRCGRAGKPFLIYKFRTMFVDAERDGKARWATKDDPRITRVGHVLRKTRLDELPQVFNILFGEMSFVGPRPERPEFVDVLKQSIPFYHTRFSVKPGLTGWAQIQYDYTSTVEDAGTKLQYDLYYIHRWTLWLDIYILFRTVEVVFRFKGT